MGSWGGPAARAPNGLKDRQSRPVACADLFRLTPWCPRIHRHGSRCLTDVEVEHSAKARPARAAMPPSRNTSSTRTRTSVWTTLTTSSVRTKATTAKTTSRRVRPGLDADE
jgi:hypothetical protein